MAPNSRIILCRHSQAEHNVDNDYSIPDAPLTPLGKKQSASLASQLPQQLFDEVELMVSSSLRRTLQSTKLGWGPAVARLGGLRAVVCLPEAQEVNGYPCDTGSSRQVLESLEEFKDFNLERLTPDWTSKKGFWAPDEASVRKRARWVRHFLRDRSEGVIVLVAHGDILREITCSAAGPSAHPWNNAEVREFRFDQATTGAGAGDDGADCFLLPVGEVAVAGGYSSTSTEMDLPHHL